MPERQRRHPRWAAGGWATQREAFAADYGDAAAEIVQEHFARYETRVRRPTAQDVRDCLRRIAAQPAALDQAAVDPLTHALLLEAAWRNLRVRALSELTPAQRHDCATHVLERFPLRDDPWIEQAQVDMTTALIAALRDWHAVRRNALLRVALQLVFGIGDDRSTPILKKARQALRTDAARRASMKTG